MIDWSKAPDWAPWCAMDSSGSWWWHSRKPEIIGAEWAHRNASQYWTEVERAPVPRRALLWLLSLTKRPAQKDSK